MTDAKTISATSSAGTATRRGSSPLGVLASLLILYMGYMSLSGLANL